MFLADPPLRRMLMLMGASLLTSPAVAQDTTLIGGGPTSGSAMVNVATGQNNQQMNVGVLAAGRSAIASGITSQGADAQSGSSGATSAELTTGAFAGSSGWVAINGVAGNDNQQGNIASFAFGMTGSGLADSQLSQTRASPPPPTQPTATAASATNRSAILGAGAFSNSSGLVQLSLIGGDRNSSANSFAMSVSGPAGH